MKKEAPEQTTVSGQTALSQILDEIEERANAASLGPWKSFDDQLRNFIGVNGPYGTLARTGSNSPSALADAIFIASARTDVLVLVKALRRQHAFIELTVGKLSRRSVRILNKEVVAILNQK